MTVFLVAELYDNGIHTACGQWQSDLIDALFEFNVLDLDPAPRPQTFPCLFDPAQKSRIIFEAAIE